MGQQLVVALIVAAFAFGLSCAAGIAAWLFRGKSDAQARLIENRFTGLDKTLTAQGTLQAEHTLALAKQSEALAVLIAQVAPMDHAIKTLTAKQEKQGDALMQLREQTAILSSELEHHQAWHEGGRRDQTPRPAG